MDDKRRGMIEKLKEREEAAEVAAAERQMRRRAEAEVTRLRQDGLNHLERLQQEQVHSPTCQCTSNGRLDCAHTVRTAVAF